MCVPGWVSGGRGNGRSPETQRTDGQERTPHVPEAGPAARPAGKFYILWPLHSSAVPAPPGRNVWGRGSGSHWSKAGQVRAVVSQAMARGPEARREGKERRCRMRGQATARTM